MNRAPRYLIAVAALAGGLFSACHKNPIDRLVNPLPDGAVPQSSGVFIIYDEELKTGGGLGLIPGSGNQSIDLADRSSSRSHFQLRYGWNGGDIVNPDTGIPGHAFAGFSLLVAPDFSTNRSVSAKDLRAAGYTKLTMWVRGSLSLENSLRIEGPNNDPSSLTPARIDLTASQLTNDWQQVSVPIPAGDFASVRVFATVSIQYAQPPRTTAPGEGGTVFIDDIKYER